MDLTISDDRAAASRTAADLLADALRRAVADDNVASLVASGGSTPLGCFHELAAMALPWRRITATLSDERWVGADDPMSNEAMLRRELLTGAAAAARFVPLYRDGLTAADACEPVAADIRARMALPFSATLLGMGSDGHFASLFPDSPTLADGLDLTTDALCCAAQTAASPVPRLSLTLAALMNSRLLLLLVFGDDKRRVLERAAGGEAALPVAHLLRQTQTPVHILWAP
ncbi:MAG: 6-phosphogluconolactonase [Pseudomonadota bacterium]